MTLVEPSWQSTIVRSAACATAMLLAVSLATTGSAAPPPGLPHDYSLRVDYATASYEDALVTVRNHLLLALKSAHAFPSGYPKPCRFRVDLPQGPGATSAVTPYRAETSDPGAQGILLDAEGHYVRLGVLDSPDLRPSLFDIFLVGDSDIPAPEQSARDTMPRIVVQVPVLGDAQYPGLVELLATGLRGAGAQAISFK